MRIGRPFMTVGRPRRPTVADSLPGRSTLVPAAAALSATLLPAQTTGPATERIPEAPGRLEWIRDMQVVLGIGFGFLDSEVKLDRWMADNDFDFVNDVICVTIDGQRSSDMYQGTSRKFRRFSTCANRPRWREYRTARDLELLPHFSAINVDVMRAWNRAQAFCPHCQQVFRDFLRTRFTPGQFQAMGVTDAAAFDFSAHL